MVWVRFAVCALSRSCTDTGSTYRPTERVHCKLVCVGEGELDGLGMCEGALVENNNAN